MFRSRATRLSTRPDLASRFILMALPCSSIPLSNNICIAERSDLSSRVGRGFFSFVVEMRTPVPLLIMSLALALDFLMSTAPRVPSGPGLALATVSMRSSMLPSWFFLPATICVGSSVWNAGRLVSEMLCDPSTAAGICCGSDRVWNSLVRVLSPSSTRSTASCASPGGPSCSR